MKDFFSRLFIAMFLITIVAIGMVIYKANGKWDECHLKGGYVVQLTSGNVCAKLEIIK